MRPLRRRLRPDPRFLAFANLGRPLSSPALAFVSFPFHNPTPALARNLTPPHLSHAHNFPSAVAFAIRGPLTPAQANALAANNTNASTPIATREHIKPVFGW